MQNSRKWHRVLILVIIILTVTMSIAFLILSTIDYETAKQHADNLSRDGENSLLTPERFDAMIWSSRIAAIILGLAAIAVLFQRRNIFHLLQFWQTDLVHAYRSLWRELRTWYAVDKRIDLVILSAFFALGLALRCVYLWQPIRTDEAATYLDSASRPIYVAISNYSFPNNHILYTLLVHFLTYAGNDPAIIRFPAMLAGVLCIPATYMLGTIYYDRLVGLLSAGLVATSSVLILYSTNARGYTMQAFFLTLLFSLAPYLLTDPCIEN